MRTFKSAAMVEYCSLNSSPKMPAFERCCLSFGKPSTAIFNLLDYAVGVTPVTYADQNVDLYPKGYEPMSELDKLTYEECKCLSRFS